MFLVKHVMQIYNQKERLSRGNQNLQHLKIGFSHPTSTVQKKKAKTSPATPQQHFNYTHRTSPAP